MRQVEIWLWVLLVVVVLAFAGVTYINHDFGNETAFVTMP